MIITKVIPVLDAIIPQDIIISVDYDKRKDYVNSIEEISLKQEDKEAIDITNCSDAIFNLLGLKKSFEDIINAIDWELVHKEYCQ